MSTLNVTLVVFGALTAVFMLGGCVGKVTGQPAMRTGAGPPHRSPAPRR